jgi:hypothetical protein
MLIIASQGNPQEHESFVVHRKTYLRVCSRVRPIVAPMGRGQKIKKNHKPVVATPSDSECSEDDNISRLDDAEAPIIGHVGFGEEQSSSGDETEAGLYMLL